MKKGSFEGECHPLECGNKDARRRNDAFLGSFDSDNLWRRLQKSIKALGSSEELRTLKVLQNAVLRKMTIKINDC